MRFTIAISFDTHNASCAETIAKDFKVLVNSYKDQIETIDDVHVELLPEPLHAGTPILPKALSIVE